MKTKPVRNDSVATIDNDGKVSNSRLHEQMTEGVDDYDFRMQTRAKLLAGGVPASVLDSVLAVNRDPTRLEATSARSQFAKRVIQEFLPQFCNHKGYDSAGFNLQTVDRISEYDAMWFLKALETKVVLSEGAFFKTPLHSGAKEQIFWQYGKPASNRKITVWAEPIISIGAAGRLHSQFGWPKDRIGLQSKKNWAFDLVTYDAAGSQPLVCCEIKKNRSEIDYLIQAVLEHFPQAALAEEPSTPKLRNAYRKVMALRQMKPRLLWILGPENYGKLFCVANNANEPATLEEIEEDALEWRG